MRYTQCFVLFWAGCKAQCFDKDLSSVNNADSSDGDRSFAMTESNIHKPADSEASQSRANGDRRTDSGERSDANPQSGEVGGPKGLEPTRYGDWERNGRCTDF